MKFFLLKKWLKKNVFVLEYSGTYGISLDGKWKPDSQRQSIPYEKHQTQNLNPNASKTSTTN